MIDNDSEFYHDVYVLLYADEQKGEKTKVARKKKEGDSRLTLSWQRPLSYRNQSKCGANQ